MNTNSLVQNMAQKHRSSTRMAPGSGAGQQNHYYRLRRAVRQYDKTANEAGLDVRESISFPKQSFNMVLIRFAFAFALAFVRVQSARLHSWRP